VVKKEVELLTWFRWFGVSEGGLWGKEDMVFEISEVYCGFENKLSGDKCRVGDGDSAIEWPEKGLTTVSAFWERLFRWRRNKTARTAKISSPKPPITPPMIEPRLLRPLDESKDGLEVPLVEIPTIALEVSDDEPVGNLAGPEDELLAIRDWESEPVDDAVPEDVTVDDALFCARRAERVKGVVAEFPL
jgi:hypothetical protein